MPRVYAHFKYNPLDDKALQYFSVSKEIDVTTDKAVEIHLKKGQGTASFNATIVDENGRKSNENENNLHVYEADGDSVSVHKLFHILKEADIGVVYCVDEKHKVATSGEELVALIQKEKVHMEKQGEERQQSRPKF